MKILIASLALFVSLFGFASADDGWVEVTGGSARLLVEHPTISMTDEYVLIEMMPDKYKVTANFNFYNSGVSTTVAVGFPVSGRADAKRKDFLSFKTWVNGSPVKVKKLEEYPEEESYEYFKVKTVQFISQSTTTSMVEYEAAYGYSAGPVQWLSYDYSTGRSWKGPIGKVVIDLRFPEELLGLHPIDEAFTLTHRAKGQMIFEASNLKPEAVHCFYADFNPIKLCLSQDVRKSESVGGYCSSIIGWIGKTDREEGLLPYSVKQPTLAVLRLRRNAIYAQYGRVFQDKLLNDFFSNINWYSPRPNYKESDLSESDRNEIKEIVGLEKTIESAKQSAVPFIVPKD